MNRELAPQPPQVEFREPRAEAGELIEMLDFIIAQHVQTYSSPHLPNVTEPWVRDHMTKTVTGGLDPSVPEQARQLEGVYRQKFASELWRVAVDNDDKIVGFMRAYIESYPEDHIKAGEEHKHLAALFVDKEYQGNKIGSMFMREMFAWKSDQNPGIDTTLEVATYTPDAIEIYTKYGFVPIAGSEHLYKNEIPMMDMVLKGANNAF